MKTFLFLLVLLPASILAQPRHTFRFSETGFLLDEKPFRIISGELHPARIPRDYWRHRIRMAKAMGCNTIALYVFWNYHEPKEGTFDFRTENRDVAAFIRLCREEGLWVLLRPGPYVCAEWDFGGLPPYLLKIPDIKIRCSDPRYLAACRQYIRRLAAEVGPLMLDRGGPVLMVQIENEYGSFGNDRAYLRTLKEYWQENGIDGPFFTADGPTPYMLEAGSLDSCAIGLDSGSDSAAFARAFRHNPRVPAFSSETYPGWLTHWGETWARPDTAPLLREVEFLLDQGKSFNFYVIHGGTNFGFTAGANAFSPTQYQPDVTSYDYDAPIDEQGRPTAKFYALRRLIARKTGVMPPPVPAAIPTIAIPEIAMRRGFHLNSLPAAVVKMPQPLPMEVLGQTSGLIRYTTRLVGHKSGRLQIWEPHDFALVFLDGRLIDTVWRDGGKWEVQLPVSESPTPVLDIVVEAMGRINFAQFMLDRKGITDRVTLNGMTLMDWEIRQYPLDENLVVGSGGMVALEQTSQDAPMQFFKGTFELAETGDTFFDLSGYRKGVVWVNGHNLGRYWNRGPQQRLYCPAPFLKKGRNEITIFDLLLTEARPVRGTAERQN